tara:strand:+ start:144 stop:1286 length:1143 start_codon:yes stop_codon:yes gene_type:complete
MLILAGCLGLTAPCAFGFETTAEHAVILDYDSNIVLYAKDAVEPMTPASMTKIMTAYVVFERLKDGRLQPDDVFTVSEKAWREGGWASGGSTMGLAIDQQVSVADLLRGMIVQSGNDACIVLAEGISGSEEAFAEEMTVRAQELGLTTASFKNSTGLYAEGHEISARDLAELARLTIENFPNYYKIYAERDFVWNDIRQPNRNPLLSRVSGADGLKTGHLSQSGYGLVGSAVNDGNRKIIVVNGLESERARAEESERMMRAAFREFSISTPLAAGDEVAQVPVWLGKERTVSAVVNSDLALAYTTSDRNRIRAELIIAEPLSAPVKEGQEIGKLEISGPDGVLKSEPVYAGTSVDKMGMFAQAFEGLANLVSPSSLASAE